VVAAEGNVIHDIDAYDEDLQCALHASREEAQRESAERQRGSQYEHGCDSSQQQGVACLEGSRGQARSGQTTQTQIRMVTEDDDR
jgi:hypothetical protein